jgi:hypothetical protein
MHKKNLWSTFRGNNDFPVYNWFYFTEAYSRGIVREIILKNPVKSKDVKLYDPFSGTGTSLLVAKEFNMQSYGTDVSYLMYLVSKGKCLNYNTEKLEKLLPKVLEIDLKEQIKLPKENEWIKKYFYAESLQCILHLKANIDNLKEKEKHFFYIVLLKTIEIVTKAKRQGADLRIRKIEKLDTLKKFQRTYELFLKELKKFYTKNNSNKEPEILNESCLTFYKTHNNKFDYIICSPPYLNKTEYTKRFGIELAILDKETIIQKHLGHIIAKENKEKDWIYLKHFSKQLDKIRKEDYKHEEYDAHEYFKQLEIFVEDSVNHLNKNGILAIVIAGGIIYNSVFDIDKYMKDLYTLNGLEILDLKINREITANRDRSVKIGTIKEFTIIGKKS